MNQEQSKSLIKGAYLGGGSINNPEKKYHLEISFSEDEYAKIVMEYLQKFGIKNNIIEKKNEYVVYLKDGEGI